MDSLPQIETPISPQESIQGSEQTLDRLGRVFQDTREFADEHYDQYVASINESIFAPLKSLRQELVSEHRSILEDLENAAAQKSLWQFQRDYREDVEQAVIERLQSYLEESEPAKHLNKLYASLLDDLTEHIDSYPVTIAVPYAKEIFDRHADDSNTVVARKFVKRSSLRFRSIVDELRGNSTEPVKMHQVPVKNLVAYHLQRRIPAASVDSFKRAHVDLAFYVGALERALSSWFNQVLMVDRKLRRYGLEPDNEDRDGEDAKLFDDVLEAARSLQTELENLEDPNFVEERDGMFSYSWELFRLGLEGRGTFLSALPIPVENIGPARIVGGATDTARDWIAWHHQVIDRLKMINLLIDLRDEMLSIEGRMIDRIRTATIESFSSAFGKLATQLEKSRSIVEDSGQSIATKSDLPAYVNLLENIRKEILGTTTWLSSLPGFITADSTLDSAGTTSWKELLSFVDTLPEDLVIHPIDAGRTIDPRVVIREISMRATVRQALHTDLQTRLEGTIQPVKQELVSAWTSAERIESIVTFNIDAAIDEIESFLSEKEEDDDRTLEDIRKTCVELAGDGLQRAQASIGEAEKSVANVTNRFVNQVGKELLSDWSVIHKTVRLGDAVAEKWDEVWSRSMKRLESARFELTRRVSTASQSAQQWIRLGERSARGLIKKGQTAVGVLDQSDEKREHTVAKLAEIAAFKRSLPVVYRRLFGFESLSTTALLEGRSRDLVWVRNFVSQWKSGRGGGVAMIIGQPGCGKTSFLNVLDQTALKDIPTTPISVASRINSEAELVSILTSSLSLSKDSSTLLELEEEIASTAEPFCILVDDAEHLFLQTSYGREVFERFMLFISRTDRSCCWILTMGKPAWRYLSSTNLRKVGFAASRELSTLDRTSYDTIIFSRHRRSGMPVIFEEVNAAKNIIADRFSRTRSEEELQKSFRESYFESLRRVSGQNIMLALMYWTSSVSFQESGDLIVKPLKPLSFDFLNRYDSGLAFTLRSLMVHKTLSVEEHNKVFNISGDDTAFILERLVNDRMICLASADPDDEIKQPDRYTPDMRFRVHPLALQPVGAMLSRSNLLH